MSKAAELRLKDLFAKLTNNESVKEQWTFYPKGRAATTLGVMASAIRIDGGRITALFEAEIADKASFSESSVRGNEILRHLPFAVSQYSIEGKLIYQNPEAVNLFGTSTAETTAESAQDMFVSRFVDEDLGKAALQQVQAGKDFSAEAQHHTELGPRWCSVDLRRTRDPVTSENIILHIARDISDIIKARKDSTQAAVKSEFMAVIAHEIRTPLHQVVGYLDLLAMTQLSDEQLEALQQVKRSTDLLMSIINDLLDYSKLESGQVQVESVNFPLVTLVQGCLASVKPNADQKELMLLNNLANDLPINLVGDPNRLQQILLNLLSNAVKFTSHGFVSLTVTCSENSDNGQRLRFEVADSGIGIDPCEQQYVFEKCHQANASVARQYGGTGLGLSICKGLTELMGGKIGFVSQVGKGATIFLEIPFQ